VGLGVRFLLDGFSWQPARLAIDLRRIDPIAGLARIFSWRSLAGAVGGGTALAALAMAAVLAIGPVALSSSRGPAEHLAIAAAAWRSAVWLFAAAAVVAGCRWLFARRRFERHIRMTPEEFAEETRSAQADPKIKLLQRQKPRQPAA
jgi:flagellar biosynthetic protein FlhB